MSSRLHKIKRRRVGSVVDRTTIGNRVIERELPGTGAAPPSATAPRRRLWVRSIDVVNGGFLTPQGNIQFLGASPIEMPQQQPDVDGKPGGIKMVPGFRVIFASMVTIEEQPQGEESKGAEEKVPPTK